MAGDAQWHTKACELMDGDAQLHTKACKLFWPRCQMFLRDIFT